MVRETEAFINSFWQAFPRMSNTEKFSRLKVAYSHRFLHFLQPTNHGSVPYMILNSPTQHFIPGIPQELIITPSVQAWITLDGELIKDPNQVFQRIWLTKYNHQELIDNFILYDLAKHPDISTIKNTLSPKVKSLEHIKVNVSRISDINLLSRFMQYYG